MVSGAPRRTRHGALVTCRDGRIGSVERMENDPEGRPDHLRVTADAGGEDLLIPVSLMGEVQEDGAVALTCTRADLERWSQAPVSAAGEQDAGLPVDAQHVGTIQLHEEQLVAHKELQTLGEVQVRTQVEEFPGRLEVAAMREEVEIEHVPVGEVVRERVAPWEEGGALIVPVYEEQLVVVKRLILREQLRIRRVTVSETQLFEDTLRRERAVVEDPQGTGLAHELYAAPTPEEQPAEGPAAAEAAQTAPAEQQEGGFLGNLVRKALS